MSSLRSCGARSDDFRFQRKRSLGTTDEHRLVCGGGRSGSLCADSLCRQRTPPKASQPEQAVTKHHQGAGLWG
jgi:hypothetical protein